MAVLTLTLAAVHALAGAAWFGSMFYSLTVLQPRAARFFERPEQFEAFLAAVSHGARRKVLAAFALLAATGAGLALTRPAPASPVWLVLIALKAVLLLGALAVFVHVSWRLWPARVLALPEEIPALRRRFRAAGLTLLALVGLSLLLGVAAHRV
jgi:uncharacterized membrane protein